MFEKIKMSMVAYHMKYDERMKKIIWSCQKKKGIGHCEDCKDYTDCSIKKYEV
jgi:hypothetical protein